MNEFMQPNEPTREFYSLIETDMYSALTEAAQKLIGYSVTEVSLEEFASRPEFRWNGRVESLRKYAESRDLTPTKIALTHEDVRSTCPLYSEADAIQREQKDQE